MTPTSTPASSSETPAISTGDSTFFGPTSKSLFGEEEYPHDPTMPALIEIDTPTDDEDMDDFFNVDLTNLETVIHESLITTTRIHKIHPKDQILGNLNTPVQTRSKVKNTAPFPEQGFFARSLHKRNSHKDLQNCLFACFLSQKEPKRVEEALSEEGWVESMQEELLQFKL